MLGILLSLALTVQTPDTLSQASVVADRSAAAVSAAPLRAENRPGIERSGAKELSEVLRSFAGVSVKDYGGEGGIKTVSLRGFGAQHSQVCYDGIYLSNLSTGQVDISRFNLDNIESIAVTIGQGNDIFRSARGYAGAGTVELRSLRPDASSGRAISSVRLGAGSFGNLTASLNHKRALSRTLSLSASADMLSSRGDYPYTVVNGKIISTEYRLGSQVESGNAEMKLYADAGRAGTLTASISGSSSSRGLPGPVILYTQDPTEHLWERGARADLVWSSTLSDRFRTELKGSVSRQYSRYTDTSPKYPTTEDERFLQMEHYISGVALWTPTSNLSLSVAQDLTYGSLENSFQDCPCPRRWTSLTAAALQLRLQNLTLTGSLLGTLVSERVSLGEPAPVLRRLSPSISANWKVAQGIFLRAGWRDGFRGPSFNDLYYTRIGNTSLLPEKASQFNVGASLVRNFSFLNLELGLDAYHNDVRDKIVATPTMFIWRMRNLGKVSMTGADLTAVCAMRLSGGFALNGRASYSFQYAVDVTDPSSKSWMNQIAYTPRNCGSAALALDTPWLRLSYNLVAVGERFALNQNKASNRIDPYWDHGIALSREMRIYGCWVQLCAEALNLADVNYEIIRCYPMPGRHWRLSAKASLP